MDFDLLVFAINVTMLLIVASSTYAWRCLLIAINEQIAFNKQSEDDMSDEEHLYRIYDTQDGCFVTSYNGRSYWRTRSGPAQVLRTYPLEKRQHLVVKRYSLIEEEGFSWECQ